MVQGGGQKIVQLEGTKSNSPESSGIPAVLRKSTFAGSVRHDSCPVPNDKTGWNKKQGAYGTGASDPILLIS